MNVETTLPPPPQASESRNPWKIFGIITIVLVLVGGAVAAGFVLGSSKDDSSKSTVAQTVPPAVTATPADSAPPADTTSAEAESSEISPEMEQLILDAENSINLIVSDYRWQNTELYDTHGPLLREGASAFNNALNSGDCSVFSSNTWRQYRNSAAVLAAHRQASVEKINAAADEVAQYRREKTELGRRAFRLYNFAGPEAIEELGKIDRGRVDADYSLDTDNTSAEIAAFRINC